MRGAAEMAEHTFVCRCEEIDEVTLVNAVAAGARTINDLKRSTRMGMGPCQGIYCLHAATAILARERGIDPDDITPMTSRPPVRSITLGELAGDES